MKTQHLLLAGALGVSAFLAVGAAGYSYWAQSAPDAVASATPALASARSTHSRQFAREGDRLMGAAKADAAIQLARAFQKSDPKDVAGYEIEARALAMNGDIAGAIRSGQRAVALDAGAHHKPRPWLDELLIVQKRYPKLRLFPISAVPRQNNSNQEQEALEARAQSLLRAKKYDEIEKIAANLLQTRATLSDGNWKLAVFARALCIASGDDDAWKANNQRLLWWHAQHPESKLATLMLARSWADGASSARGGEYADKVKPKQWSGMNRRLRAAAPLFAASLPDIKRSPLVFSGLQQWAILGQVPPELYEAAWRDAESAFPGYLPFYIDKAYYLMPRWYGAPGEWEAFAKRSADKIAANFGSTKGDMFYARLVEDQSKNYEAEFFQTNAVSWERTKRGLRALIARDSQPASAATAAQRLAAIAQDSPFERELFSGPLAHHFVAMSILPNEEFVMLCRNRIHAFAT